MMIVDPYRFAGSNPVSFTDQGYNTISLSVSNVLTATGVAFGPAIAGRTMVLTVHWLTNTSSEALTSATIGGVAATIHTQGNTLNGFIGYGAAVISAPVPAGTSGTVTLTFVVGAGGYQARFRTFNVLDLITGTANDTDAAIATTASVGLSVDLLKDGVFFSAASMNVLNPLTLAGITEIYQDAASASIRFDGGASLTPSNISGQAISLTVGTLAMIGPFVTASFR